MDTVTINNREKVVCRLLQLHQYIVVGYQFFEVAKVALRGGPCQKPFPSPENKDTVVCLCNQQKDLGYDGLYAMHQR